MLQTIADLDSFFAAGDAVVTTLYVFFLFGIGAVAASFSCLVAYRMRSLDEGASILKAASLPASHCDSCGKRLSLIELIPVIGWIASRGRCPSCGSSIPVRYPALEFALGAACAALPFLAGGLLASAPLVLALLVAFLAAVIDWDNSYVPEEITWVLLFTGLFMSPIEADLQYRVAGAAVGALGGWFMTSIPGLVRGIDTRAWGDVAMTAGVGAWLGCFAVPAAFMLAAVLHLMICAANGAGRGEERVWTPFGPALMAAFVAMVATSTWVMPLVRPAL